MGQGCCQGSLFSNIERTSLVVGFDIEYIPIGIKTFKLLKALRYDIWLLQLLLLGCRDFRNSNKLNFIKGLPPLCMCVLGLISKHIRIRLASHSAIHRIPNLVVCQYLNLFYGTMHTYMYTNVCIKARLLETSRFQDKKGGTCTAQ